MNFFFVVRTLGSRVFDVFMPGFAVWGGPVGEK